MNQLVGQFLRHGRHEIPMLSEKVDVLVIGRDLERIDLDGVSRPVLEKQPQRFFRQRSRRQSLHELGIGHALLPAFRHLAVNFIDAGFGFGSLQFYVHTFIPTASTFERFERISPRTLNIEPGTLNPVAHAN